MQAAAVVMGPYASHNIPMVLLQSKGIKIVGITGLS
jgi:hypothetical protein